MTVHEAAIKLTQTKLFEMKSNEIDKKYDGKISLAAQTIYENYVKEIMKENDTSDLSKEIGTYIAFPGNKTVHFVDDDKLSD